LLHQGPFVLTEVEVEVIVWIIVAVLLVLVELHHLAFFAVFGAAGAAGASIIAAIAPHAIGLQLLVFVGVAVLGMVGVRPFVSRAFARRRDGVIIHGVHGGLIGARGVALDAVSTNVGHIKLIGETWLATSANDVTIPAGTQVLVTAVTGTTLTVWPIE